MDLAPIFRCQGTVTTSPCLPTHPITVRVQQPSRQTPSPAHVHSAGWGGGVLGLLDGLHRDADAGQGGDAGTGVDEGAGRGEDVGVRTKKVGRDGLRVWRAVMSRLPGRVPRVYSWIEKGEVLVAVTLLSRANRSG